MPGKTWAECGIWRSKNTLIIKRTDKETHFPYFEIFPTGNISHMPIKVSSVKFENESMTIFDVTGDLFAGRGKEIEINIRASPNKVITAEISVKGVVQK